MAVVGVFGPDVTFGDDAEIPTADELLKQADHAMYDAKRAGGNRVSAGAAA